MFKTLKRGLTFGAYLATIGLSAFSATGCSGKSDNPGYNPNNQYHNMTIEERVDAISTPWEAHDHNTTNVLYADQDNDPKFPIEYTLRKDAGVRNDSIQSVAETARRGWVGVCRDTALLVAALTMDDGYPPYLLTIYGDDKDEDNHMVFMYQGDNGKWGSANKGLSNIDYHDPIFDSIEDLVAHLGKSWGFSTEDFAWYDLSLLTQDQLINGMADGMEINFDAFLRYKKVNGAITTGETFETEDGFFQLTYDSDGNIRSKTWYDPDWFITRKEYLNGNFSLNNKLYFYDGDGNFCQRLMLTSSWYNGDMRYGFRVETFEPGAFTYIDTQVQPLEELEDYEFDGVFDNHTIFDPYESESIKLPYNVSDYLDPGLLEEMLDMGEWNAD